MFDVFHVLKYAAITLALFVGGVYYARNYTHLLSPAAVCQENQFCGGTEPLIAPDAPRFHWDDKLSPEASKYLKDHPSIDGPPSEHQEQGLAHKQYLDSHYADEIGPPPTPGTHSQQ